MFDRTANARIIFEEEFKRQTRRIGWRAFTVGVPLIMIIIAFVVPLVDLPPIALPLIISDLRPTEALA